MKLPRVCVSTILIVASSLLAAIPGAASDDKFSRKSLRGIPAVAVLIEQLSDDARRDGLSEQDIRTDVELKLRLAGIKVLAKDEASAVSAVTGNPYLYVKVITMLRDDGLYVYSVHVGLYQDVLLERDQDLGPVLGVETWSTSGGIGSIGRRNLPNVRRNIKDDIDEFVNAYLSVNPRK